MKPVIVGGGIIGCYLASQIRATVIDRKPLLGTPVACTGLLTNAMLEHMSDGELKPLKHVGIHTARIQGPKEHVDVHLSENHVLNKEALVKYWAKRAQENGSTILTNHQYTGNAGKNIHLTNVQTGKRKVIGARILIGADGPVSNVAKYNGLFTHRTFLSGVQTLTKYTMPERIDFHPHIGEYAWAVPESKHTIRVGVAARNKAKPTYDDFAKQYSGKVIEHQSGAIPLYHPKASYQKPYIALVGDAGAQNKNTTGGGIITGFRAADALAKALHKGKPQLYTRNLKPLRKELYFHYLANHIFNKFNAKDWDKLIKQFQQEKTNALLQQEHRDNLGVLATKLLISNPSFLLWSKKLFTHT